MKRILTVQDISCVGQCSLTVALPILSACGVETCVLPSAVLSTHTGGFQNPTFRDLTEDIPAIAAHWQREGITFDGIYTGYLGSTRQIDYVKQLLALSPGGRIAVDPAMADHGKLYKGFDEAFVQEMKGLCALADVVLPNLTELCMLTDTPWQPEMDRAQIQIMLEKLHAMGAKQIVLTGIGDAPERTGAIVFDGSSLQLYSHDRVGGAYHGTGDIFSSVCYGAWMQGKSLYESAELAAEFTRRSIENTVSDPDHWYGVRFEPVIAWLAEKLAL
jgi:pyridoxine kinase